MDGCAVCRYHDDCTTAIGDLMSDRIEREVEELLAGLDKFPLKKPLSRRLRDGVTGPFSAAGGWFSGLHLPSVNAGHLLLAAIIIIVIAYVAGGDSSLWTFIIAGGIFLFIAAFVLSLRRQSRPSQKYWRDRPMDTRDSRRDRRRNRR